VTAVQLVIVLLVVIGTAIAMVLLTVVVSSVLQAHRLRLQPLEGVARQAIANALSGREFKANETLTSLHRFSKRCIVTVMLDLAPSVSGTSRLMLNALGEEAGVLERARRGVRRRRWSTRLYSARVLTAFGVESDDMCVLLTDRSPEVRAQAAAWVVVTPNQEAVELLIGMLADSDGLCRFAAKDALIRIGLVGSDALTRALVTAGEELTESILEVAAAISDDRFFAPSVALIASSSPSTRALAAKVLARTGNPQAGAALVALLNDPSSEVVLAATAGVGQLAFWPGAVDVEPLLNHESWELRRQAALTLLALGAPGTILLRANAPGEGPAAQMAVQALQLDSLPVQIEAA
jgi:HEAT repeat protein